MADINPFAVLTVHEPNDQMLDKPTTTPTSEKQSLSEINGESTSGKEEISPNHETTERMRQQKSTSTPKQRNETGARDKTTKIPIMPRTIPGFKQRLPIQPIMLRTIPGYDQPPKQARDARKKNKSKTKSNKWQERDPVSQAKMTEWFKVDNQERPSTDADPPTDATDEEGEEENDGQISETDSIKELLDDLDATLVESDKPKEVNAKTTESIHETK